MSLAKGLFTKTSHHFSANYNFRYTAVCRPFSYSSRQSTTRFLMKRNKTVKIWNFNVETKFWHWTTSPRMQLLQFLAPVVLLSVLFNLPRCEGQLFWYLSQFSVGIDDEWFFVPLTSAQVLWGDHSDWDAEHHHWGQHDLASRGPHLRHHRSEDGPHLHQVQPVSSQSDWARCFRFYINWTRLVFTCMLPVIFLILLNYKIFRGIRC